jgi:hypothetical protein
MFSVHIMYLCVGLLSMNVYYIQVPITQSYLIQLIEKYLTTYLKIKTYVLSNLLMLIWSNILWYINDAIEVLNGYVKNIPLQSIINL